MKSLTLLIKPSSSNCNLNCSYCFYKDCAVNRNIYCHGNMDISTLEQIVIKAFDENVDILNFMFQGGEPTLVGLDFYKQLIYFQNKFNKKNIIIKNSIQTNGVNIDEAWCEFFKNNNFLIGISLDGPESIHDKNRVDYNNYGSFSKVYNCICLLKKYNIEFNILSVVTNESVHNITEIYKFYKENNFKYIQFIPCIKNFNEKYDNHCMTTLEYYNFLDTLFNLWYSDLMKNNFINIKNFMDFIPVLKGYRPTSCGMGGFCSIHTVIESNGDIYPCDFYCVDEWKLGNINNSKLSDLISNDICRSFFNRSTYIHPKCMNCKYFKLCGGGCRRNLEPFINNIPSFNYQCDSLINFFDKNFNKLLNIAKFIE